MTALTHAQPTMTSREIATVTKKSHRNVKADIFKMLVELKEDVLSFQHIYFDSMNRRQIEYVLDRELTETLLTGYSAVLRRKVIVRLRELEDQIANAEKTLLERIFALDLREAGSKAKASIGSRLLNIRKKEIKPLREERAVLETAIQPSLL